MKRTVLAASLGVAVLLAGCSDKIVEKVTVGSGKITGTTTETIVLDSSAKPLTASSVLAKLKKVAPKDSFTVKQHGKRGVIITDHYTRTFAQFNNGIIEGYQTDFTDTGLDISKAETDSTGPQVKQTATSTTVAWKISAAEKKQLAEYAPILKQNASLISGTITITLPGSITKLTGSAKKASKNSFTFTSTNFGAFSVTATR